MADRFSVVFLPVKTGRNVGLIFKEILTSDNPENNSKIWFHDSLYKNQLMRNRESGNLFVDDADYSDLGVYESLLLMSRGLSPKV